MLNADFTQKVTHYGKDLYCNKVMLMFLAESKEVCKISHMTKIRIIIFLPENKIK